MREEHYRDLLRSADHPKCGDWPPGFDRDAAEARFLRLAERIEQVVDRPCYVETGAGLQDSAFHGQVLLPTDLWNADGDGDGIFVRASNFGNLATIACDSAHVPEEYLRLLAAVLTSMGYEYVPEEILWEPYDGEFSWPCDDGRAHPWWDRYFNCM